MEIATSRSNALVNPRRNRGSVETLVEFVVAGACGREGIGTGPSKTGTSELVFVSSAASSGRSQSLHEIKPIDTATRMIFSPPIRINHANQSENRAKKM
jgi:hypothetical protein